MKIRKIIIVFKKDMKPEFHCSDFRGNKITASHHQLAFARFNVSLKDIFYLTHTHTHTVLIFSFSLLHINTHTLFLHKHTQHIQATHFSSFFSLPLLKPHIYKHTHTLSFSFKQLPLLPYIDLSTCSQQFLSLQFFCNFLLKIIFVV